MIDYSILQRHDIAEILLKLALNTNQSINYPFYTQTQIKVKEQVVVRNDMDVNEHERLSDFTLRHKLK